MPGIPILTRSAREQIAKTVHEVKTQKTRQSPEIPRPKGSSGIIVEVRGPAVLMTTTTPTSTTPTTTTTTTTTSSTGTTSSTTPCLPNSTTAPIPTTTLPGLKYVYPGRFVYRNIDSLDNQEYFYPGEDVWIEEMNQRPLGLYCKYPGHISSQYMGQLVVAVRNDLPPAQALQSCTGSASTTTPDCACTGYCEWTLSGGWVLVNNFCGGTNCNCPQPNFCPPDRGCANTITYCTKEGDPDVPLINCAASSSTSSGTTTTEEPCGECFWKYLGVEGNIQIPGNPPTGGWTLLSHDCNDECSTCLDPCSYWLSLWNPPFTVITFSGGGVGCIPHPRPAGMPDWVYLYATGGLDCFQVRCEPPTCEEHTTPCRRIVTTTQPSCFGNCGWVWPDEPGQWWLFSHSTGTCHREGDTSPLLDCICYPPSIPGTVCGQYQETCCSASCGSSGCDGQCTFRCDFKSDPPIWLLVSDCGSDCDCATPIVDCSDPCDIIQAACIPTTVTTSTTSTTTTTSCPTTCVWTCSQDSFTFYWELTTPCGNGCDCQEVSPQTICSGFASESIEEPAPLGLGSTITAPCIPPTSSTSSTTTTTIDDPCEPSPCSGFLLPCHGVCIEHPDFPGLFTWAICPGSPNCTTTCNFSACPPCNAGVLCSLCVGLCPQSPTSATGTTVTDTETTLIPTTLLERPTTTTEPAVFPGDFDPLLWIHCHWVYEDLGGTDSALAEDELIKLAVYPGDDPTAPTNIYATQDTSEPPFSEPLVHYSPDKPKWIEAGTDKHMALSDTISQDLTTADFTIIGVFRREPSSGQVLVPISGSGTNDPAVFIDSGDLVHWRDDYVNLSTPFDSDEDFIAIWTVESQAVYFQASGMAKTLLGQTRGGTELTDILAVPEVLDTDVNALTREIIVYGTSLAQNDLDDLYSSYFTPVWGVAAPPTPPVMPFTLSPLLYLMGRVAYQDTSANTPALADTNPVQLMVRPDDSPSSPAQRIATATAFTQSTMAVAGADKSIRGGSNIALSLSSAVSVNIGTTDFTAIIVFDRTASASDVMLGSSSTQCYLGIHSDNNFYIVNTVSATLSTSWTGGTGRKVLLVTVESGTVYVEANGLSRTSIGSLGGTLAFNVLTARTNDGTYSASTSRFYDWIVLDRLLTSQERADILEEDGYTDRYYGVYL